MEKVKQCVIKTELALAKRNSQKQVLFCLRAGKHVSHTRLNKLIKCISEQYAENKIHYFNT